MINDKCKGEIISKIDDWFPLVEGSIWGMELKLMRSKYIFKDVSKEDYEKDLLLLKNIEHTFWDYYTNKN
jgi:hypothetical protein